MARRNPPNRVNNIPYMLYLSEEQMRFIRERSKALGKSQAEYCRGLVEQAMKSAELTETMRRFIPSGKVVLAHGNDEFAKMYKQALEERMPKHDDSADALVYAVEEAYFVKNPLANQSEGLVKSVTHGQVCDTMKTGEE